VSVHQPSTGSAAVSTSTGTSVPVTLGGDVVAVRITAAPLTVAGAPTALAATPYSKAALLTWTVPASDGGSAMTGYVVSGLPGGKQVTVSARTRWYYVSGLRNGTRYALTVRAVNAVGTSVPATVSVTPGSTRR
jgi:hypothetical protein